VFILLVFYTAPLSALAEVFRTHSSASLYLPFAAMNVINGLLWTTYGLALGDSFIYVPNMVRQLGMLLLKCCTAFVVDVCCAHHCTAGKL
jgi:hypothetical protein